VRGRVRRASIDKPAKTEVGAAASESAFASIHCARADANSTALLVQLLLALDRKDLAQTTYQAAKRIGNDSTLIQAMEAWIGLKTVSPAWACFSYCLHVGLACRSGSQRVSRPERCDCSLRSPWPWLWLSSLDWPLLLHFLPLHISLFSPSR
jgi:hypothetical protein